MIRDGSKYGFEEDDEAAATAVARFPSHRTAGHFLHCGVVNALGDITGLAGVVLAIGSILAAWVFYQRGKRERRPTHAVTGNRVVVGNPKRGIEVSFRGESVPVVSRTLVVVWNEGRETIRRGDVTEDAPLTVSVNGVNARILEASVVAVTRPEIGFRIDVEPPRSVVLSFHHLDHKDGATIEVLHTAPHPSDVDLTGDVMGTQGRLRRVESPLWDDPGGFKMPFAFAIGLLVLALGQALYSYWVNAGMAAILSLLMAGAAFASRRSDRRRLPTALWHDVPGGLPFAAPQRPRSRSVNR